MSHFSVLVIGPDVDRQLAPYQENNMGDCPKEYLAFVEDEDSEIDEETGKKGYWRNPNSKWDYYRTGGRWAGHFKVKVGVQAPPATPGYEAAMGLQDVPADDRADIVRKGDIDFAAMRDEAADSAAKKYDFAMGIIGGLPVNRTWPDIRDAVENGDLAREQYWNQPRCLAWKEAGKNQRPEMETAGMHPFFTNPDEFLVTREKYIQAARESAFVTFAVVKDGKWYERGSMGWWACVSNEKDAGTWTSMFSKLIDELPDDTQLTVVDCHI